MTDTATLRHRLSVVAAMAQRDEAAAESPRPDVEWIPEADAWLIRSYEAIRFVLRNDERLFRLAHSEAAPKPTIAKLRGGERSHRLVRGEEHERLHRWYMRWFLPDRVEEYRNALIEPMVDRIIDRFAGAGSAELCIQFCQALGPRVIAGILGLPVSIDDERFFERSQQCNDTILAWNSTPQDDALLNDGVQASQDLNALLLPTIRDRRREPRDDLISRMWNEGETIMGSWSEEDTVVATREMLLGASGTTREALANALYLLLSDGRVRRDALSTDVSLANFAEESLRLNDSRTLVGLPRIAEHDVEVAGVKISRDQLVVLLSDSGSTDPDHYPAPTSVDVGRPSPKDHFAFSAGARACIGANLARAQIRTALGTLFARLPALALDPTKPPPGRSGTGNGFGRSCYGPLYVTL